MTTTLERRRRVAWILIVVADVGYAAWGLMAGAWPDHLLGPGGKPILAAGYEGFSKGSWSDLAGAYPLATDYMVVLFRMYGVFNLIFAVLAIAITVTAFRRGERWAWWALLVGNTMAYGSAMTYDRIVNAIGPFELTEYIGLALIWGALAATAPIRAAPTPVPALN